MVPPNQSGGEASSVLGVVVDPYIVDAVLQEIDPKGKVLQESTPSDEKGQFSFANALSEGSLVKMKVSAQSRHNNAPYSGILKVRPAGQQPLVVSPLTTLIANGLSAEEVVNLLQGAGLSGFTHQDVFADPMEGTDDVTGIGHLERLQASLAVNAFLALNDNYGMGRDAVADQKAKLAELVQSVRTVVDPEMFQQAESAPQLSTLTTGTPRINFGHFLKAAVAITDAVVAKKKVDIDLNAIDEAGLLLGSLPELTLFYYAQENRGVKVIEDRIKDGILPDASPGAIPVIEASGEVVKNTPPVASAGSGKRVSVTDVVQLDAGASNDADGDALSYRWTLETKPQGSQAVLDNIASPTPTFITDHAGSYELTLVVNDGHVNSAPSTVVITAVEENDSSPVQEPHYEAPVLESVEVNGTSWILQWSQPGDVPEGGYDIFVDGQNTGTANRTSQSSINLSGLSAGVQHCFKIESRYIQAEPDLFKQSNQVCAEPVETIDHESTIDVNGVYAFPNAEGFGRDSKGGRGGAVYKVTNLNNSGPGSLRACIEASGARNCVFEVSGTIDAKGIDFTINNPYLSIWGQTAPSPGIQIKNGRFNIYAHDIVIQHLRLRGGMQIIRTLGSSYNVVVDHCTLMWAMDDVAGIWPTSAPGSSNITYSNNIIAESAGKAFLSGTDYASSPVTNSSVIKNLFKNNKDRAPRVRENNIKQVIANNFIHYHANPYEVTAIGSSSNVGPLSVDIVNNYYEMLSSNVAELAGGQTNYSIYYHGNDDGGFGGYSGPLVSSPNIPDKKMNLLSTAEVKSYVMANVGARPSDRDIVESRLIKEITTNSGRVLNSIDSVEYPYYQVNTHIFNMPFDPSGDSDKDGYTNLEERIHLYTLNVEKGTPLY